MDFFKFKSSRGGFDRVILHFDYDCFYAQVIEKQQPALKSVPLGIKQKAILATCNYEARRRGVTKLMLVSEARKCCPELVLADGEDLTPFRDASSKLYGLLRSYSWNSKLERLGMDEVFMDVTDIITYNVDLLNREALDQSFFCLSRADPVEGFPYDARTMAGNMHGKVLLQGDLDDPLYMRLLVASHFARYLRLRIEEEGYTSACGIATNKVLAKLVGTKHKPRNQTTLVAMNDDDVCSFMDALTLRSIPGIGPKTTRVLETHLGAESTTPQDVEDSQPLPLVGHVRNHPEASRGRLEKLLSGPGFEKGLGAKIWSLLHGIDPSDVKLARDTPTQISIEDTYQGLDHAPEIAHALRLVCHSLLRRVHADLLDPVHKTWLAHPRTIRLTTRPKTADRPYNWARASRSVSVPGWALRLDAPVDQVAGRLVDETLLPLFRALHPSPAGWHIGLLNVCMTNMVPITRTGTATGRDIAEMFRRQQGELRGSAVIEDKIPMPGSPPNKHVGVLVLGQEETEEAEDGVSCVNHKGIGDGYADIDDGCAWDGNDGGVTQRCLVCGHLIPTFALVAHSRFHDMGNC